VINKARIGIIFQWLLMWWWQQWSVGKLDCQSRDIQLSEYCVQPFFSTFFSANGGNRRCLTNSRFQVFCGAPYLNDCLLKQNSWKEKRTFVIDPFIFWQSVIRIKNCEARVVTVECPRRVHLWLTLSPWKSTASNFLEVKVLAWPSGSTDNLLSSGIVKAG